MAVLRNEAQNCKRLAFAVCAHNGEQETRQQDMKDNMRSNYASTQRVREM